MGPLKMLERRDIPPEIDVVHKFPPLLAHPLASWLHIRNRFYVCHASTSCYLSRNIRIANGLSIFSAFCSFRRDLGEKKGGRRKKNNEKVEIEREILNAVRFQFPRVVASHES